MPSPPSTAETRPAPSSLTVTTAERHTRSCALPCTAGTFIFTLTGERYGCCDACCACCWCVWQTSRSTIPSRTCSAGWTRSTTRRTRTAASSSWATKVTPHTAGDRHNGSLLSTAHPSRCLPVQSTWWSPTPPCGESSWGRRRSIPSAPTPPSSFPRPTRSTYRR